MNDTPPSIRNKIRELYREKTPLERLRMGSSLYDCARLLVENSIRQDDPEISKSELKKKVFLLTGGYQEFCVNDFYS
jgi:hypothetical protein